MTEQCNFINQDTCYADIYVTYFKIHFNAKMAIFSLLMGVKLHYSCAH